MRSPSRIGDGWGLGLLSATRLLTCNEKSLALSHLRLPRLCDRSLSNLRRFCGGRSPPGSVLASILPDRLPLFWPVSALFTRGRS